MSKSREIIVRPEVVPERIENSIHAVEISIESIAKMEDRQWQTALDVFKKRDRRYYICERLAGI